MKLVTSIFVLLLSIATTCHAARWSTQDYEIFDVQRGLEQNEGHNATFYSFLNLTKQTRSTTDDISKAYRKRSLEIHPDKNVGVKGAQKRFERLGLIAKMLRTPEVRTRYDFFYVNGFPKWKGTGYFYSRYRPGVGTVSVLLLLLVSWFHYLALFLSFVADRRRLRAHVEDARKQANWPFTGKRKRVAVQETNRVFAVEADGQVFLLQHGQEFALREEDLVKPGFKDSLLSRLPLTLYQQTLGRLIADSGSVEQGRVEQGKVGQGKVEDKKQL